MSARESVLDYLKKLKTRVDALYVDNTLLLTDPAVSRSIEEDLARFFDENKSTIESNSFYDTVFSRISANFFLSQKKYLAACYAFTHALNTIGKVPYHAEERPGVPSLEQAIRLYREIYIFRERAHLRAKNQSALESFAATRNADACLESLIDLLERHKLFLSVISPHEIWPSDAVFGRDIMNNISIYLGLILAPRIVPREKTDRDLTAEFSF